MHQIFVGLIHQGGKTKCVSKMSEKLMLEAVKNCLIRRPKVRIALDLASNNFIYLLSNNAQNVLATTLSWKRTAEKALHV